MTNGRKMNIPLCFPSRNSAFLFLQDSTRQEGEAYIGKLKEDGFAEVHKESEEKAVSALLQKEDVFVSVAVADTGFAIYISFKE